MNVRPLHDRLIVRRLEEGEPQIGGIIIPDAVKERPQLGTVLAVVAGQAPKTRVAVPTPTKPVEKKKRKLRQ